MKIYVGNLAYSAGEGDIRKAFEAFGEVSEVNIIIDRMSGRSKGFGFVEMPNDDEAKTAMAELNGTELDGRQLNINEARPQTDKGDRGGRGDRGDRGDRGGRGGGRRQ